MGDAGGIPAFTGERLRARMAGNIEPVHRLMVHRLMDKDVVFVTTQPPIRAKLVCKDLWQEDPASAFEAVADIQELQIANDSAYCLGEHPKPAIRDHLKSGQSR